MITERRDLSARENRFLVILFLLIFAPFSNSAQDFYLGVDLSYVNQLEDCGTTYFNQYGIEEEPYQLFADNGANTVRLRLWHDPEWTNYSNFEDVKKSIGRAKALGLKVILDLHYSDFWADPSRQWRPAAWNAITDDQVLGDSVYQYTYNILLTLSDQGLLPDIVQIGNEINGNILIKRNNESLDDHSSGLSPVNWPRQVSLLDQGINAVRNINSLKSSNLKTLIHIAQPENAIWWFRDGVANGLEGFDIIGLSYYPQWSELGVREVGEHIAFLKSTYQKEVMIVETGYPWTIDSSSDNAGNVLGLESSLSTYGTLFSKVIQREFLTELTYLVKANGGLGVIYWEPAWVSSSCNTYWATGSHFENAALFDFDNQLHEGADFLSYDYNVKPDGLKNKKVTFMVNMTGIDTKNGVFVTGSFTGTNWEFVSMVDTGDNIFELETTIDGRSSGAYIFYNKDQWSNVYREEVPVSCAKIWDTHRQYDVNNEPIIFEFAWESCTNVPNSENIVSAEHEGKVDDEIIPYPNPANDRIIIPQPNANGFELYVLDVLANEVSRDYIINNEVDLLDIEPGIYILKAVINNKIYNWKIIKQ